MEIKHQLGRPDLLGMPQGPQSTIIRNKRLHQGRPPVARWRPAEPAGRRFPR
jgi:hypothetical protein